MRAEIRELTHAWPWRWSVRLSAFTWPELRALTGDIRAYIPGRRRRWTGDAWLFRDQDIESVLAILTSHGCDIVHADGGAHRRPAHAYAKAASE
jgi:hypothetical protein